MLTDLPLLTQVVQFTASARRRRGESPGLRGKAPSHPVLRPRRPDPRARRLRGGRGASAAEIIEIEAS